MPQQRILLVDDDPVARAVLRRQLEPAFIVDEGGTAAEGLAKIAANLYALVLVDMVMPGMSGEEMLINLRASHPNLPVIVLTSLQDTDLAVRCIKIGAADFLAKPCGKERLLTTLENVLHLARVETRLVENIDPNPNCFDRLYGNSEIMRRLFEQLHVVAGSDIGVLLEGASGTGKELVASALHHTGARKKGPFVALNCAAIPENLLESELFGHEKGAFTGAIAAHAGCFEQASGGTLLLDEIGEMRMDMQVRLLRALENREIRRLGSTRTLSIDVRVIAATNRDLRQCVAAGTFRKDLYFRLAVYQLRLPALSERGNDVAELAERFSIDFAVKQKKRCLGLEADALAAIRAYSWPGNVRELRNAIERAVLLSEGPRIALCDLPEDIQHNNPPGAPDESSRGSGKLEAIIPMAQEEERILRRALRLTNGDVTKAAVQLEIARATLYRRLKEMKIIPAPSKSNE